MRLVDTREYVFFVFSGGAIITSTDLISTPGVFSFCTLALEHDFIVYLIDEFNLFALFFWDLDRLLLS
jgi:hypothetical protein